MYIIGTEHLSIAKIPAILQTQIELSTEAIANMQACRDYLDKKMQDPNAVYYGINTGFGSLCNVRVENKDLEKLQENLVLSHACGAGAEVPQVIVKLMLLLKIKNFVYGNSGVSVQVVQRLVDMYNADVLPVVYEQGSLGASGDLAPLAHLCLPLLGQGEVYYNGKKQAAAAVNKLMNWSSISLQSKEGLALLNGTQFMSSFAVYACLQGMHLYHSANKIACISIDGFDATLQPFDALIHAVRAHEGQIYTANNILETLADSQLATQAKSQVQDPYSFRCIPQVHGASFDVLQNAIALVEIEINAVTDNPLIFPKEDKIFSGGNFHGQPLALQLDFLAIALAELANISERRTYLLISGQRNLPAFLTNNAGLQSGLMIAQYTAASIVSANKQLCTPASVDSIVSSNGQEDHVSMGANAATKLWRVLDNVAAVLGIELLTASQALSFRDANKTSTTIQRYLASLRIVLPLNTEDRILSTDMKVCKEFIGTVV
ncbi:MAG: Histidine ammonia-lyase [Bacteroidota bacterium]|jgi:histidine ammonia-lyase